ncbi:PhoD-like phosphatase-domain-containing protein, partial [Blastocladiella britannica]
MRLLLLAALSVLLVSSANATATDAANDAAAVLINLPSADLLANIGENLVFSSPLANVDALAIRIPEKRKRAILAKRQANSGNVAAQFAHGVASGDPLPNAFILWTKVTPATRSSSVPVAYQVSTTKDFSAVVRSGAVLTTSDVDFTVKIDVTGLAPATRHWYRFITAGPDATTTPMIVSPVGTVSTLVAEGASLDKYKMAIFTCSNMPHGYFRGFSAIAADPSIDVTIHLGDYIYEYDLATYMPGNSWKTPADRIPVPNKIIVTLDEYRARHAQYKTDGDLQTMHAAKPLIAVWDDHEFADNAYVNGSVDHNATSQGPWSARKLAAARAYHEYMPIRPTLLADGFYKVYRQFRIGDLVDLLMLDTRTDGRTQQAVGDPNSRMLIGDEQRAWLYNGLSQSTTTWRVLGNQVMFAPKPTRYFFGLPELNSLADDWNGYPKARQGLLDHVTNNKINDTVILTGMSFFLFLFLVR